MPEGRTSDYAIWRACERFYIKPPGVKDSWDQNDVLAQANLIAYNQIREIEDVKYENDKFNALVKALYG